MYKAIGNTTFWIWNKNFWLFTQVDPLGMVLNGVVDAAVNGGIANYKVFFSEDFVKDDNTSTQQKDLVKKLRHITTIQVVCDDSQFQSLILCHQ